MSALYWNDVRQLAATNQDGASGFPPEWVIKRLEDNLEIEPLRFGGDDYGYLMWFRPQAKSVERGLSVLKDALSDYDNALAKIAELQAQLAEARATRPEPKPKPVPVEATKAQPVGSGSGEEAYTLRMDGLSWPEIGERLGLGSPLNSAKKHARSHGLPWPPAG